MSQVQCKRKEVESIQEENTMEDPCTQEVLYYNSKASLLTSTLREEVICIKHQMRRNGKNQFQGELRKMKLTTFYGENKMGEDVESWLQGIRKYF
jgi:hypothetical protein